MELGERVIGCFQGLATGDAVGKQTETLSHDGVRKWYPSGVNGFAGPPGSVIPRYAGTRYEWRVGETTDDTEQTLAVARAVLREPDVNHTAIGMELLRCTKSLHPGVSLWQFVQTGDPARIAREGDGCGAAMRGAPIGVRYTSDRLDELVRGARECALPTHGGTLAICAAAAVAGAVSAALDGRPADEVLSCARLAAQMAEIPGPSGPDTIANAIQRIHADLSQRSELVAADIASRYFPDRPQHVVPVAISLAVITRSAEQTALLAANIGGDADSVASIAGAIAGALRPETLNREWIAAVNSTHRDELVALAASLAALRGTVTHGPAGLGLRRS